MTRMHKINQRLSTLLQNDKHIVYFITEDRDILEEVFAGAAPILKALGGTAFQSCLTTDDKVYTYAQSNLLLADAYDLAPIRAQLGSPFFAAPPVNPVFGDPLDRAAYLYLTDFHLFSKDKAAHLLKQFLRYARERADRKQPVYLLLISPVLSLPDSLQGVVEIIDVPELEQEDVTALLKQEAVRECFPGDPRPLSELTMLLSPIDCERIEQAAADFKGVSRQQILSIANDLRCEFGSFFGQFDRPNGTMENLARIKQARLRLIAQSKAEQARHDKTVTMLEPSGAVAGLDGYRRWLDEIKDDLLHPDQALQWGCLPPKGVLLTGVPGSGKTQAAKLTAHEIGVSLVQFRMDNLLGGLVGDSEANFKRCRKRIEALAPCVVLIDEMEKIFGGSEGSGSHEVKMNLLAALLDWLQENQRPIFFFATSNSVRGLRPELLRDGRFDMRFCVFMPTRDELAQIICYHLQRAGMLSHGRLLGAFHSQFHSLALRFLEEITAYGEENHKNMFYTGANIEALISQTNRELRRTEKTPDGLTPSVYLEVMLKTAKSDRSQPYGVTNLEDIADFWLSARKNQYASASGSMLIPFESFRPGDDSSDPLSFPPPPADAPRYDRALYRQITEEICRLYQQRRQNGR